MVYLIGGSSHVGKTLLAQRLMEKIKIPYLSLDHLKMGLIRAGLTELNVNQDGALREFMWPVVSEIIKTAIENKQNLIVEGCYIPCDWAQSFSEEYTDKIRSVFIVMGECYIRTHSKDIVWHGDAIETRLHKAINVDRLVSCSKMFEEWAEENACPCLKIDNAFSIEDILKKTCTLLDIQ